MTTLEAVLVAILFIAPGLAFEFGIERQVSYWRTEIGQRTLRFFLLSVLFHALLLPLTLTVISLAWVTRVDDLVDARWALWALALGYTGIPLAAGCLTGWAVKERKSETGRRRWRWLAWVVGRDLSPQAWDALFSTPGLSEFVRVRLRDGRWVAGVYGGVGDLQSFASSYPEPRDLLLAVQVAVDPETGQLRFEGEDPVVLPWSLWVDGETIELVETYNPVGEAARTQEAYGD